LRKHYKFILLALFTVFIFWFFGRNLNWKEVSVSLSQARPLYLILAVLGICFGYFLRALRWKVLLEPITESSLRELFATTTVGYAAIFLIGRAGELVRPMWLPMRDPRVRPSAALVTLGVERIFDLASIICFFAVTLIWFNVPEGHAVEFGYVKLAGNIMLAGVVAGFVALIVYQRVSARAIAWVSAATDRKFIPKRIRGIIISLMKQLTASLQILTDWREIASVTFWTIMLWLSIAIPTWLVLLAFDLPLTFLDSLFIMGWAAIGSIVPTPGGAAGAFHVVTARGLMFLGISVEQATAVAIAMHLVYFAPAIVFGLYYFFHGDISYNRFKSLLSSEHAVEDIESEAPGLKAQPETGA
jgi:uncharacterized protein (TIRG00374 family)